MNLELKLGDTVQLKSGSPTMTVSSIDDGGVFCVWFVSETPQSSIFAPCVLVHAVKDEYNVFQPVKS